jgi:glycosyltransferase involved in cell wall biosynthesis
MSARPKISVIIPFRNQGKYLASTLQSVLRQKYSPYEIIVVDDASDEPAGKILKRFINLREIHLRLFTLSRHSGVSVARNTGIKEARGTHIAFTDADDCWGPDHLSAFAQWAEHYGEINFFSAASKIFTGKNCPAGKTGPNRIKETEYFKTALRNSLSVNASSVIFSIKAIERTGLFNENLPVFEDMDYWIRAGKIFPLHFNTGQTVYIRKPTKKNLSLQLDLYKKPHVRDWFLSALEQAETTGQKQFIIRNIWGTIMRFKKKGVTPPAFLIELLDTGSLSATQKILLRFPDKWIQLLHKISGK